MGCLQALRRTSCIERSEISARPRQLEDLMLRADAADVRRLSDLDEKQRLETDELRHPLLAYSRLHIQSNLQTHEPELLHSTQWETTLLAFSSVLPHCRRASAH